MLRSGTERVCFAARRPVAREVRWVARRSVSQRRLRQGRPRARNCAIPARKYWRTSGKFPGNVEASRRMAEDRQIAFDLFRFDPRTGQLWRDGGEVKLTPRAAAVLQLLRQRALELVTTQDVPEHVWGGMAVGDDALASCIQELRGALGDDARRPHYIETRHRRGYRLMVPATFDEQSGAAAPPLQVA